MMKYLTITSSTGFALRKVTSLMDRIQCVQSFERWVQRKSKQIVEIGLNSRRAISTTELRIKRQLYLLKHPISISFHSHMNSLGINNLHWHSQTRTHTNIHTDRDINIFFGCETNRIFEIWKYSTGRPEFQDIRLNFGYGKFYIPHKILDFRPFYCIKRAKIPISTADKHHLKP